MSHCRRKWHRKRIAKKSRRQEKCATKVSVSVEQLLVYNIMVCRFGMLLRHDEKSQLHYVCIVQYVCTGVALQMILRANFPKEGVPTPIAFTPLKSTPGICGVTSRRDRLALARCTRCATTRRRRGWGIRLFWLGSCCLGRLCNLLYALLFFCFLSVRACFFCYLFLP